MSQEISKERIDELMVMLKDLPLRELLAITHFVCLIIDKRFIEAIK
jgi:hypothetical protein